MDAMPSVVELRERGNQLFKARRLAEATACYREALAVLRERGPNGAEAAAADEDMQSLGQAVRLNLATCLMRLGEASTSCVRARSGLHVEGLEEVIVLCDEVFAVDPTNAKAAFRRGSARRLLARQLPEPAAQRKALQAARRDLLQAARAEPDDRKIRSALDEVTRALLTRALRQIPQGGGSGLFGRGQGLYDDVQPSPPPPPPVVCSTCGRIGHEQCGRACWVTQRAKWLGMPEDEVGRDPEDFEDDGALREAVRAARSLDNSGEDAGLSDLSDEEREMLEECLDQTERPYPALKRRVRLPLVVSCAEELWREDGY